MNKIAILEGLLFVVGDEGLSIEKISELLEVNKEDAKKLLTSLKEEYEQDNRGIRVSYLGDVFKLTTKKEHTEYYQKLVNNYKVDVLSNASLETLAIIAYNGPITRIEINEIRGIESSHIIRKLIARDLVKVAGKSSLPGNPNLYKVTNEFLDYFGLSSLNDLPEMKINIDKDNDRELFERRES